MTVRAVTDMVKGVAMAIGIEATIKTVMELAEGIRAIASSYGADPMAEVHFAAAAQYGITAALAFAVSAPAVYVSRLGTYDAMAFMFFAFGLSTVAMEAVKGSGRSDQRMS